MFIKTMSRLIMAGTLLGALPAGAETMLPGVSAQTSAGMTLVDSNGMTLYTSSADVDGKSMCNGDCSANWVPLAVAADAEASGDWTIITRDDGMRMWAFKGHPVYTSIADKAAGDVMGDVQNGFSIVGIAAETTAATTEETVNADLATVEGAAMMGVTVRGAAWVTASGMTLYVYEKDDGGKSMCNDDCAVEWPPLAAPVDATGNAALTVVVRDDGTGQWALYGRPLYTFVDDKEAGEVRGDNIDGFHLAM